MNICIENKYVKDKNIVKFEVIVIFQRNMEKLRKSYLIQNTVYLKKFL